MAVSKLAEQHRDLTGRLADPPLTAFIEKSPEPFKPLTPATPSQSIDTPLTLKAERNLMSASAARIEANRTNALTHGLTARQLILPGEDPDAFAELRDALSREFRPATAREEVLTQELAEAHWRLLRCRRQEVAFQSAAVKQARKNDPKLTEDEAAAAIFMDPVLAKQLALFLRYQRTIENACHAALAALKAAIDARFTAAMIRSRITPSAPELVSQSSPESSSLPRCAPENGLAAGLALRL